MLTIGITFYNIHRMLKKRCNCLNSSVLISEQEMHLILISGCMGLGKHFFF